MQSYDFPITRYKKENILRNGIRVTTQPYTHLCLLEEYLESKKNIQNSDLDIDMIQICDAYKI